MKIFIAIALFISGVTLLSLNQYLIGGISFIISFKFFHEF
jgi:hypothetical protein